MTDGRRPRLAFLHYSCPPVIGGVETVLAAQARLLRARGYAVTVMAGRGRRFNPDVRVVLDPLLSATHPRVRAVHAALDRGDPAPVQTLADEIGRKLRRRLAGIDLCVVHNVFTLAKNLALTVALHDLARSSRRPRLVAWTHDVWEGDAELGGKFPWNLVRTTAPGVAYVAVTETAKMALVGATGVTAATVRVIPNGIDEDALAASPPAAWAWLDRLRLDARDLVLLMPVRVTRRKNLELAIDVTAELARIGLRPRLLITGPPGPHTPANREYLQFLRSRAAARGIGEAVTFLARRAGRLTDRMVGSLYQRCDGVLLTSTLEGFGLPPLEAGLFRVPVFCTDIPAFREVAGDEVMYFALDDPPPQIAQRIAAFFDSDRAARLRRHVRTAYLWDAILRDHLEPLIRKLTDSAMR